MGVLTVDSLLGLLQAYVPGLSPSTFRLLRGRDEGHLQHELVARMNAKLRLH